MKSAAFAIALLTSGAAIAQTYPDTTTTTTTTTGTTPDTTTPSTMPDTAVPADTTMPQPSSMATDPSMAMTPATGQAVQPSNADPEHDARGIAVISDAAVAPAGFNGGAAVGGPVDSSAALATQPAGEDYPACSRTVTDNCVQSYERGRSPR
jgi:hypothetical protein